MADSAAQDAFLERVRETIAAHEMLAPGEPVIVTMSGGADSMALLHALRELGYPVQAMHLNHMLRGEESDADEAFVIDHCEAMGIPCHCSSANVRRVAEISKRSMEETARDLRYVFFVQLATQLGVTKVATGHHADDQAETVLMRVLRGTGLDGLTGIPTVREKRGVFITRPLIDCTRAEITAWLREQQITWREDLSNTDPKFLRNRIRHELLPHLASEYNPQIGSALTRMATNLREDAELLDQLAEAAKEEIISAEGEVDPALFAEYPAALQLRVVQKWVWCACVELGADRLREVVRFILESNTGQMMSLSGDVAIYRAKGFLQFVSAASHSDEVAVLNVPGGTIAFGKQFHATLRDASELPELAALASYCTPSRQVFDADAVGDTITVRTRRDGDRFTPFGMTGSRKLQDYFVDRGVPVPLRDTVPLVLAGERIAWVVGHAFSAAFAVNDDTERVMQIDVHDATE